MQTHHLVDTAVFEIDFSDEEVAFVAQSELESFIKRRMLGVVEQVFNTASEAGIVMRIPRLEIDLGAVAYADYQDELPKRLQDRLSTMLGEFRLARTDARVSSSCVIDTHQADYAQLEYFLLHGHLPWYCSLDEEVALEALLHRALRNDAGRLKNFLRTTPYRRQIVTRLVSQFPLVAMDRLFHLLSPSHATWVIHAMQTMSQAWRNDNTILNALGLAHDAALARLWGFLIELVLGHDGHQYSAAELLTQALRQMLLDTYQINPKVLSAFVADTLQTERTGATDITLILRQVVQEQIDPKQGLARDSQGRLAASQSRNEPERTASNRHDRDSLGQILVAAVQSGDSTTLDTVWDELTANHGAFLKELLYRYGQQATLRRKLAQRLHAQRLREMLQLLEPLEHEFVTAVIDRYDSFRPSSSDRVMGRDRAVRQMWEFSLGYILVERGSRFNKKSYLASMLRQMAASENLHFQTLLEDLLGNLDALAAGDTLGRNMREWLLELREEQVSAAAPHAAPLNPGLRGYELYDQLHRVFVEGVSRLVGGQAGLVGQIEELRQRHPWQLLRMLRELQSGAWGRVAISSDCSASVLRELVMAFVELTSQSGPGAESELLTAINAHAPRSPDQRQFYRRLLDRLIKGEWLDFDAILTGIELRDDKPKAAEVQEAKARAQPMSKQPDAAATDDLEDEEALHRLLCGNLEPAAHEIASLRKQIARQLSRRPERFLEKYVLADRDEQWRERLVRLLPDHQLAAIVVQLAGPPASRMLLYAELITLACQDSRLVVTSALLRRSQWTFILSYLVASGCLINEPGFIRQYVARLNAQSRRPDLQMFCAELSRRLLANILPTTRDASRRIIDILASDISVATEQISEAEPAVNTRPPEQSPSLMPEGEVYINNAGLVLAAPYVPRLFEMLGLTEKTAFKDSAAALQAVHVLQYLADENTACPEYRLFLNKLLCGVATAEPIPREMVLSAHAKEVINGLLQGMIDNWKALGNTSVAGLREAFLQRQGRLQLRDDAWHLQVESKAYDMLLDQLPWGFSTIKYPWMERVVYVEWR